MKHFDSLMKACDGLLINLEMVNHMIIAPMELDVEFEITAKKLKDKARQFYNKPFYDSDEDIHYFIFNAKQELSEYLIDKNKRDLVIDKVETKVAELDIRLSAVIKKWNLNHVDRLGSFYDDFFMKIQPFHNFVDWFRLETGLFAMVGREMVVNVPKANEFLNAHQFLRKLVVRDYVFYLSEQNIEFIHKRNFSKYVYRNSDRVRINGIEYDYLEREIMRIKLKKEPIENYEVEIDGQFAGFSIQESDFINEDLQWLDSKPKLDAIMQKKSDQYKKYLLKRLELIQSDKELIDSKNDLPNFQDSPFTNKDHFDKFIKLHKSFNLKNKVRWTYIFNVLKERERIELSEENYFSFICAHFETVAKRTQKTATNERHYELLNNFLETM